MIQSNYRILIANYQGTIYDLASKQVIKSGEFREKLKDNISKLKIEGIASLERVGIIMNSSVGFIINYFSLIEIGAVPILLSKYTTVYEIEQYDEEYGIHWILTDMIPQQELNDVFDTKETVKKLEIFSYEYYIQRVNGNAEIYSSLAGMTLQPTSGSTGTVKFCVRDEYGCLAEPINHAETTGWQGGNIFCPLPLNHAYGFGTAFLLAFVSSSDLTLLNEFNPRQVMRAFQEQNISMFLGTNAIYDLLTKMRNKTDVKLPKILLSAGAPLSEEVSEKIHSQFNRYIYPSYGSTETGEICLERADILSKSGSTGIPLRNTKVYIEKVDDKYGQVIVSNPSLMVGYLNPDGTIDKSLIREGNYFPTGDLGYFDEQGRLILQGRLKNMINVFGIKVNPVEVEKVIREIEGVTDVYVYAGKHRSGSDLVFAEVSGSKDLTESNIIEYCRNKMTMQKVPSKVFLVDKVPRNASGKIIRDRLHQS